MTSIQLQQQLALSNPEVFNALNYTYMVASFNLLTIKGLLCLTDGTAIKIIILLYYTLVCDSGEDDTCNTITK